MESVKKILEHDMSDKDIDIYILNNIVKMNELYTNETDINQKNKILQFLDIINFKKVIDGYGNIFQDNILINDLMTYKHKNKFLLGGLKYVDSSSKKKKQQGGNGNNVLTPDQINNTINNINKLKNFCKYLLLKYKEMGKTFSETKYDLTNPHFIQLISSEDRSFEANYNLLRHILIVNIETGKCVCFYEYIMKKIFQVEIKLIDGDMTQEIKIEIINGYKYISEMRKIAINSAVNVFFDIEMDNIMLESEVIDTIENFGEHVNKHHNNLKEITLSYILNERKVFLEELNKQHFFEGLNHKEQIVGNDIKNEFILYQNHKTYLSRQKYENFEKILDQIILMEGVTTLCLGGVGCATQSPLVLILFLASGIVTTISYKNKEKYLDAREITKHIETSTVLRDYFLNDIYLVLDESTVEHIKTALDLFLNRKVIINTEGLVNINTLYLTIINQNQKIDKIYNKSESLLNIEKIKETFNSLKELNKKILATLRSIINDHVPDPMRFKLILKNTDLSEFDKKVKITAILLSSDESDVRQILSNHSSTTDLDNFGFVPGIKTFNLPKLIEDQGTLREIVVDNTEDLNQGIRKRYTSQKPGGRIRRICKSKKLRRKK
jgi:hypothetical protein